MYTKEFILEEVDKIRDEIGHDKVNIFIEDIYLKNNELWIITEDRPDKSAIIGKGGWVVGKLKEKLGLESIHVESYGDFLNKEYKLKLSLKTIHNLSFYTTFLLCFCFPLMIILYQRAWLLSSPFLIFLKSFF